MSQYLSGNDDDLFDYDPSVEDHSSTTSSETSSETTHSSTDHLHTEYHKKFVEDVKTQLNINLDADLDTGTPKINIITSNLYASFQEAINGFISSIKNDYFSKSVHITLDHLTNGHFSMVNMFYFYEMKIVRKLALVELFGHIVIPENEQKMPPFLEEISQALNLNFTQLYYTSTFKSTVNILNHSLTVDRIIYRYLSSRTNIPVDDMLMRPLNLQDNPRIEDLLRRIEIGGFRDNIRNQMFSAFFESQSNGEHQTLPNMLEEFFNTPISYMNTYKTM